MSQPDAGMPCTTQRGYATIEPIGAPPSRAASVTRSSRVFLAGVPGFLFHFHCSPYSFLARSAMATTTVSNAHIAMTV